MAISVGGPSGGIKVELNIVPLIDILLVLLVIFMIMPHRQAGLDAQIPQPAQGKRADQPDAPPVVVQVLADGTVSVNRQPVSWDSLQSRLEGIFKLRAESTAFVRGDDAVEFEKVAQVIGVMRGAGIIRVGLLTPGMEKSR